MEEEGLTQADLARAMGVSRASVSRVLGGLRSPSSRFVALLKIAFPKRALDTFFEFSDAGNKEPD